MKKLSIALIAAFASLSLPFAIYWLGGGNFDRGEALALTAIIALFVAISGFAGIMTMGGGE